MPHVWAGRLAPVGAVALLALALLFAVFRAGTMDRVGDVDLGASHWLMTDFRTIAYFPATAFADGINPYDDAAYRPRYGAPAAFQGYPPAVLLINAPYAALGLSAAILVKAGTTVGLTGLLGFVSLKLSGIQPTFVRVAALLGILLLSRPGHWNLMLGQLTTPMVLAVYVVLSVPRERTVPAGIALAIAMLKPTYGIPLAVVMLFRQQIGGLLLGGVLTAAANLAVLAVLAERSGGFGRAVALMLEPTRSLDASDITSNFGAFRIDASGMLSRITGRPLGLVFSLAVAAAVIAVVVYGARRYARRAGGAHPEPLEVGLTCAAILLCVYHNGYDLLLLTWPATALAWRVAQAPAAATAGEWFRLSLLGLLAVNYLSTYTVLQAIGFDSPWAVPVVSVNSVVLLALFASYAWEAVRSPAPVEAPA